MEKWWNTTANSYNYPPEPTNGFQLDTAGKPIQGTQTLTVGLRLDRFGSEYGPFLAPAGAPYNERSIPPSNLDTPPSKPTYPYNYHVYEVTKEFDVTSGPIAGMYTCPFCIEQVADPHFQVGLGNPDKELSIRPL